MSVARAVHRLRARLRDLSDHARSGVLVERVADGEGTARQRSRVAAHVSRCWTCSERWETLLLVKASLRARPRRSPVPPPAAGPRRFAAPPAGATGDGGRPV
ncbi:hypothetical protein [Streptomyces sp. YIM 98790]|uniref:hypothetical protein n=1 Tax=Streptomyces sp. YIM 98790 TaxID=2689077 RepID=UPI00140770E8|nr:hypothetical protein [Streptomyces sp. YIM 98790]